jgi:hypothetical protein
MFLRKSSINFFFSAVNSIQTHFLFLKTISFIQFSKDSHKEHEFSFTTVVLILIYPYFFNNVILSVSNSSLSIIKLLGKIRFVVVI